MEINHFPPPSTVAPIRAPSTVDDGDSGPNSPHYRRPQKKRKASHNEQTQERAPRLEGSTSHIDIKV